MSKKDITNKLNNRIWLFIESGITLDETETTEFLNIIANASNASRKTCKNDEEFKEFLKEIFKDVATIEEDEDELKTPKIKVQCE